MSIVLVGSTSGSITLQEPAVAGSTVLDLPATSGTLITTGSSGQSIPKAALPTGSVLQVVNSQTNGGTFSTTSTSFTDSGYSLSITPTSATSKILIIVTASMTTTSTSQQVGATLYRNATSLNSTGLTNYENSSSGGYQWVPSTMLYLDSPATTSSTTYKVYFKTSGGTGYYGAGNAGVSFNLMEISA